MALKEKIEQLQTIAKLMDMADPETKRYEGPTGLFDQFAKDKGEMITLLTKVEEGVIKIREMLVSFLNGSEYLSDELRAIIQVISAELGDCIEQAKIAREQVQPLFSGSTPPWKVHQPFSNAKTILKTTIQWLEAVLRLERIRVYRQIFDHLTDNNIDPDSVEIRPKEKRPKPRT